MTAAEPVTRERGLRRPTVLRAASFLAIEPGADRTDHILSAALPTAIAVSLAREDVPRIQMWLQYPFDAVLTGATIVLGGNWPPPSLERLVQDIAPRPVYLIYGGRGQAAENALTPAYFQAATQPKTLWEIPEAEHTGGLEAAHASTNGESSASSTGRSWASDESALYPASRRGELFGLPLASSA